MTNAPGCGVYRSHCTFGGRSCSARSIGETPISPERRDMGWLKALSTPRALNSPPVRLRDLELVDVSDRLGEFDPTVLSVVPTAPVWMTRAERLLVFTMTFTLRPARYLEIGTLRGGSALLVAAAMDALQTDGRLVCLDPEPQIAPADWDRLKHRTTLLRGFSPDALPEASRLAGGSFDLVLIDGDHTAAGVVRDATGVLPFLGPGAHVLFHDCFNPDVARGIDEFVGEHARRLRDFGAMTREISCERAPDGTKVVWGGLRMVIVDPTPAPAVHLLRAALLGVEEVVRRVRHHQVRAAARRVHELHTGVEVRGPGQGEGTRPTPSATFDPPSAPSTAST